MPDDPPPSIQSAGIAAASATAAAAAALGPFLLAVARRGDPTAAVPANRLLS